MGPIKGSQLFLVPPTFQTMCSPPLVTLHRLICAFIVYIEKDCATPLGHYVLLYTAATIRCDSYTQRTQNYTQKSCACVEDIN